MRMIAFAPNPRQLNQIFYDVFIESSTFLFWPYSEVLLQSNNTTNVYIRGYYIATNNSGSLVSICNSLNICAYNNTFVHHKFAVNPH